MPNLNQIEKLIDFKRKYRAYFSEKLSDHGENHEQCCTHKSYRKATKKVAQISDSVRHFKKYEKHRTM